MKVNIFTLSMVLSVLFITGACSQGTVDITEKAAEIHGRVMTVDTHVDSPNLLLNPDYDIGKVNDPAEGGGQVDFPRMKQGGVDAICFATCSHSFERACSL
jgi:membrane dipeptidase